MKLDIKFDLQKITLSTVLRSICILQLFFYFVPIWSLYHNAFVRRLSLFNWTSIQDNMFNKEITTHYSTLLLVLIPLILFLFTFIRNKEIKIAYIFLSSLSLLVFWILQDNLFIISSDYIQKIFTVKLNFLGGTYMVILVANVSLAVTDLIINKESNSLKSEEAKIKKKDEKKPTEAKPEEKKS
jgi:hypothetical protein